MADHGSFVWNELATNDVEGAKAFYGDLLGWGFKAWDMGPAGTYHLAQNQGQDAGGIMDIAAMQGGGPPSPCWMSCVAVDDVDAVTGRVEGLGGRVVQAPFDVPDVGRMSVIQDPTGAVLYLMTMKDGG